MTSTENSAAYSKVIARAWSDDDYKRRLQDDPNGVLAEAGIDVPTGLEVRVVENTPSFAYLVIPAAPSDGEISEEALGQVTGGTFCGVVLCTCA